eukprot:scaffold31707_cov124-Isochrysis_galbana.AAC.8
MPRCSRARAQLSCHVGAAPCAAPCLWPRPARCSAAILLGFLDPHLAPRHPRAVETRDGRVRLLGARQAHKAKACAGERGQGLRTRGGHSGIIPLMGMAV